MEMIFIFLVTFVAAIDQFNFLESLYQPIVMGPLVGAILGNVEVGLVVGGTYQLMTIGNMPVGGAQPPNAVIGGVVATIFAVKANLEPAQAVGLAVPFALIGQMMVTLIFTLMSPLMKVADDAATNANPKGIRNLNFLAMVLLGTAFGIVAVLALSAGSAFGAQIESFFEKFAWIKTGLEVGGGMLRYVGFAILMKIMLSGELWGYYFAGFAAATIIGAIPGLGGSALIILALIGAAFAVQDFMTMTKMSKLGTVGGETDGI